MFSLSSADFLQNKVFTNKPPGPPSECQQFGSRSRPTFCWSSSGFKLFAKGYWQTTILSTGMQRVIIGKYFSVQYIVSYRDIHAYVQWATLVTHHFFRAHIFWQKCWNRTFSMIIYLFTFYLFDNIEKKLLESLMRIILLLKGNFDKFWKMHVQAERLYFLFLFCARHYPWWSLWQKNTKNNLFIQVKPLFLVVEFNNTVTFWGNARFNAILTSVTIIKLGFLRKLFCN